MYHGQFNAKILKNEITNNHALRTTWIKPAIALYEKTILGMAGYRKRDMPRMGLTVPFAYHLALRCKSCKNKTKQNNRCTVFRHFKNLSVNFGARLYGQFQFTKCAHHNCWVRFLRVSCFRKSKLNSWFLHDFRAGKLE